VALACLGERLTGSGTQASPEHILHVPLPAFSCTSTLCTTCRPQQILYAAASVQTAAQPWIALEDTLPDYTKPSPRPSLHPLRYLPPSTKQQASTQSTTYIPPCQLIPLLPWSLLATIMNTTSHPTLPPPPPFPPPPLAPPPPLQVI